MKPKAIHKAKVVRVLLYRADKRASIPKLCRFTRIIAASVLGFVLINIGLGQEETSTQNSREKLIQEAYAKHDVKIRQMLPPYSGPPLLLDLYQRRLDDGTCDPGYHLAWENDFNGIMGGHPLADLGFSKPADSTATTLVTIDTFGPIYSLPAKRSFAVVIAKPIGGKVCIPQSRRYLYTKFTLEVVKTFRKGKNSGKQEPQKGSQITAVEFGGSVRFPSGYLETFLLSQKGFVEIGKQYVLFMWKPIPADDLLVISQAYLIRDGLVFPVSTNGDAQKGYTKMPLAEFEGAVQAAVDRNIDTDLLPNVHAAPHRRK